MTADVAAALQTGLVGLGVGLLLGFCARLGDFCTLGALETALIGRDFRRIHIWSLALGVAILTTHLADAWGLVDIDRSLYRSIAWNPVASVAGGLLFGYGMAMAGNCGFGALVRAGSGDIRSVLIVVVLGIATYATLSGPLAPLRVFIFPQYEQDAPSGIGEALSAVTGLDPAWLATALGLALIATGLRHPQVRHSTVTVLCAAGVGMSVVLAFIGTTWVARIGMDAVPVEGPSYTAPVGRTILYLMTATGTLPSFSVGLVTGTLAGAVAGSLWRRSFRWEACDDPRELGRQLSGAIMMGIGGVIAMGCTIGQGLTGTALLAWSGPVTLMAITAGAWVGLQRLLLFEDL
ncbi:YeeE/YedE family protein [Paracoccus xiamenensis]|uniref:YeeE/YedE family protein n=1 Tax=Paracoccus xiamenensis TaxID=2714901 RepID=UPI00140E3791|nr:YeeE/YedE family protein [Paracoccus xiamenensis]NHF74256.1 YeeE/YedE family protein [Paracoccus xiamenensis]